MNKAAENMDKSEVDIFNKNEIQGVCDLPMWISEAKFGLRHVMGSIEKLPKNSNVLEVGCGSGILLSMLVDKFPLHRFSGIEPFGDGFSELRKLDASGQFNQVNIEICGYEKYRSLEKYDLIYCINVFEHVADWRDFLYWASKNLNVRGEFIVLCPNYSFPYESHLKIPIVINKEITHRFFARRIIKFEKESNAEGLWKSLNFVKKREIKKYIHRQKGLCLEYHDDLSVIDDMVERVKNDPKFKRRQAFLGKIAMFLISIGLFNWVKSFPNFLPYMKITFRKIQ